MRSFPAAMLAACAMLLISTEAQARRANGQFLPDRHGLAPYVYAPYPIALARQRAWAPRKVRHQRRPSAPAHRGRATQYVAHPAGCPRTALCGCGVARRLGLSDRSLWLAANWLRFPRAAAGPGMVAARRGHVFAIIRLIRPGVVLAYDPNSGQRRTRIHERSLAGFTVVNPRRGRA